MTVDLASPPVVRPSHTQGVGHNTATVGSHGVASTGWLLQGIYLSAWFPQLVGGILLTYTAHLHRSPLFRIHACSPMQPHNGSPSSHVSVFSCCIQFKMFTHTHTYQAVKQHGVGRINGSEAHSVPPQGACYNLDIEALAVHWLSSTETDAAQCTHHMHTTCIPHACSQLHC